MKICENFAKLSRFTLHLLKIECEEKLVELGGTTRLPKYLTVKLPQDSSLFVLVLDFGRDQPVLVPTRLFFVSFTSSRSLWAYSDLTSLHSYYWLVAASCRWFLGSESKVCFAVCFSLPFLRGQGRIHVLQFAATISRRYLSAPCCWAFTNIGAEFVADKSVLKLLA